MSSLDKIIHTLNLSASDTRDETIKSIIENTLHSYAEGIHREEIQPLIKTEFEIDLFDHEVLDCLEKLEDENSVIEVSGGLTLSEERKQDLIAAELKLKEQRESRRARITGIINEVSPFELNDEERSQLLEDFTKYIYECFLQYGRKAINLFTPIESDNKIQDQGELIKSFLDKFKTPRLKPIFKNLIEIFPEKLSSEDLEYLRGLAKKTECFYSLGLEKELHEEILNLNIVNWIVFLDTNFLYSLLDLHDQQENFASKQLIELVNKHQLDIKFSFIPETQQELINKKKDFERSILRTGYTKSQMKALLRSDRLDNFSRSYFERKISDPEGTSHPAEVVDHHIEILKQKGINVYQSSFKRLKEDENYLLDQLSKFRTHEDFLNSVRQEKGYDIKQPKDEHLLWHDVFLREAILSLRSSRATSLNEIKYFGVTLDRSLLKFDKYEIRRENVPLKIPTFFLPSVLLGKISKFLPLITDDYRKAFITAISSSAFEESNRKTSLIVQQSVKKFHNMGIEDEELILSCVSKKVFLSDFEKHMKSGDDTEFIESAINKEINRIKEEKTELESTISDKDSKLESEKDARGEAESELHAIKKRFKELSERQELFEREFSKLNEASKKSKSDNPINQGIIDFEGSEKLKKSEEENKELKKSVDRLAYFKWQIPGYVAFIPALALLLLLIMVFAWQTSELNFISAFMDWAEGQTEMRKEIIKIFFPIIIIALEVLCFRFIWKRVLSPKSYDNFKKTT